MIAQTTADRLEWSTILISGPDARSFLDGQLSQAIDASIGGVWTLVLDPTGYVLTHGWVRGNGDEWELLVPSELAEDALKRLQRFKIRVDCRLELLDRASDVPLAQRRELFINHWPWVEELRRNLTPHSFGAEFVDKCVSFTKGCFTGQELVGRMDARGASMPWRFIAAWGASIEAIDEFIGSFGPEGPKGVTTVFEPGPTARVHAIAHRSIAVVDSASDVRVEIVN